MKTFITKFLTSLQYLALITGSLLFIYIFLQSNHLMEVARYEREWSYLNDIKTSSLTAFAIVGTVTLAALLLMQVIKNTLNPMTAEEQAKYEAQAAVRRAEYEAWLAEGERYSREMLEAEKAEARRQLGQQ